MPSLARRSLYAVIVIAIMAVTLFVYDPAPAEHNFNGDVSCDKG